MLMKLQRLKLTQVNNVELRQDEMTHLIGATSCGCACKGEYSTQTNGAANWNKGYTSIGGGNKVCGTWGVTGAIWDSNL